jgi:hypothetical protein
VRGHKHILQKVSIRSIDKHTRFYSEVFATACILKQKKYFKVEIMWKVLETLAYIHINRYFDVLEILFKINILEISAI